MKLTLLALLLFGKSTNTTTSLVVSTLLMSREQGTQGQPPLFKVGLARTRLRSLLAGSRPIVAKYALQVHSPITTPLESNHMHFHLESGAVKCSASFFALSTSTLCILAGSSDSFAPLGSPSVFLSEGKTFSSPSSSHMFAPSSFCISSSSTSYFVMKGIHFAIVLR